MRQFEYFPEIPNEWTVGACKHFFEIKLGKMLQPESKGKLDLFVPYLKAINVNWGRIDEDNLSEMWATKKEIEEFNVVEGDLLVCEGGEVGRGGILKNAPKNCIIQNALHRVRAKSMSSIGYLLYLLYHTANAGWFSILCNKATIAHFTGEKFGSLKIPLPPLPVQKAIAAFLDKETARIDMLIAKKERQIELLQEKRQAVITRAVTKGLDPNAKMKDSGVPWIGEIPVGWEVKRLKHFVRILSGFSPEQCSPQNDKSGVPYYKVDSIQIDDLAISEADMFVESKFTISKKQSILFPKRGMAIALNKVGVVSHPFSIDTNLMGFTVNENINITFLYFILKSISLIEIADTTTIPQINNKHIESISIAIPSMKEQLKIIRYLTNEIQRNTKLKEKIQSSIFILREYRSSLITAAVSGQINISQEVAK